MNRFISLFLIVLAYFASACVPTPEQYTELENRDIDAMEAQSIHIQVDYGELVILESMDSRVSVTGRVLFDDELEYLVSSKDEQILIKVLAHRDSSSKVPLYVVIRLPQQMKVRVETGTASVVVQDFKGDLEVASTSSDITLEHSTGRMTVRSDRGHITLRESSGIVSVVGNYGPLTAQNVRGDVSISTIMGNIVFRGLIQQGDNIRLETDHGSVSVDLSTDSALTLQTRSTSGDVTCLLPGVISSTRTCEGEMQSGGGSLSIRTVSGAVNLQLIP